MQIWLAMAAAVKGTSLSTLFSGRSSSKATEPLAPPLRPLTSKVPASWKARRSRTGACRQKVLARKRRRSSLGHQLKGSQAASQLKPHKRNQYACKQYQLTMHYAVLMQSCSC